MKRWIKWTLIALVTLALAAGIFRMLKARKDQQAAVAATTQAKTQTIVELAQSDVSTVQTRELAQGLAISGGLRAVNTAVVKAKVAGAILGLTLREGDSVKAGQIVGTIDTVEYQARVTQAQRQANAAKTQIDIAQRQYDNNKALVDQGFISKTALDTSLATLEGAKASFEASTAGADVARKSLDDAVLRAPISGQVSQRLAQPGERVGIDGKVIEITDLSRLELEASLSAADSVAVRVGQTAALVIEGGRETVQAQVVRINPTAQAGSRSVLVYLSIDNPAGLRQGLFAQGTLGTATSSVLAVPLNAVRTDKPEPYVQVIESGKIMHKAIKLGRRGVDAKDADNQTWVAVSGLSEGTKIINGALGMLREGTVVKFTATGK